MKIGDGRKNSSTVSSTTNNQGVADRLRAKKFQKKTVNAASSDNSNMNSQESKLSKLLLQYNQIPNDSDAVKLHYYYVVGNNNSSISRRKSDVVVRRKSVDRKILTEQDHLVDNLNVIEGGDSSEQQQPAMISQQPGSAMISRKNSALDNNNITSTSHLKSKQQQNLSTLPENNINVNMNTSSTTTKVPAPWQLSAPLGVPLLDSHTMPDAAALCQLATASGENNNNNNLVVNNSLEELYASIISEVDFRRRRLDDFEPGVDVFRGRKKKELPPVNVVESFMGQEAEEETKRVRSTSCPRFGNFRMKAQVNSKLDLLLALKVGVHQTPLPNHLYASQVCGLFVQVCKGLHTLATNISCPSVAEIQYALFEMGVPCDSEASLSTSHILSLFTNQFLYHFFWRKLLFLDHRVIEYHTLCKLAKASDALDDLEGCCFFRSALASDPQMTFLTQATANPEETDMPAYSRTLRVTSLGSLGLVQNSPTSTTQSSHLLSSRYPPGTLSRSRHPNRWSEEVIEVEQSSALDIGAKSKKIYHQSDSFSDAFADNYDRRGNGQRLLVYGPRRILWYLSWPIVHDFWLRVTGTDPKIVLETVSGARKKCLDELGFFDKSLLTPENLELGKHDLYEFNDIASSDLLYVLLPALVFDTMCLKMRPGGAGMVEHNSLSPGGGGNRQKHHNTTKDRPVFSNNKPDTNNHYPSKNWQLTKGHLINAGGPQSPAASSNVAPRGKKPKDHRKPSISGRHPKEPGLSIEIFFSTNNFFYSCNSCRLIYLHILIEHINACLFDVNF